MTDANSETQIIPRVRPIGIIGRGLVAPALPSLPPSPPPARSRGRRRWLIGLLVGAVVAVPAGILAVTGTTPAAVVRHLDPSPDPNAVAPNGVGDIEHLTPKLRDAIRRAIAAARADGVELRVTSGWRSQKHQQELYDEAIAKYGSPEAAREWVLPPGESAHVRGEAVDVGPAEGAQWLERHGVRFGLCRRYANESWHFERLAGAKGSTCPAMEPHA